MKFSRGGMSVFFAVVLTLSLLAAVPVYSVGNANRDIVLVRTADHDELMYLEDQGANILETYDIFTLVELDPAVIPQLERIGMSVDRMEHRTNLYVRDQKFDFTRGEPEIPSSLRVDEYAPGVKGQYIVHTIGPIAQGWVPTLEDMGVQIMHYMPNYAYRVRMTPESAREVSELYFVDWVGIYHPYYKLQPGLEPGITEIGLAPGASRESLATVRESTTVIDFVRLHNGEYYFIAFVRSREALHRLVNIVDVSFITPYVVPEVHGERATQTIGGGLYFFNDDGGNPYRKHGEYGSYINQIGYEGTDIIICFAGTGLGGGTPEDQHVDFQDRVIGGYSYSGGWEDGLGHETPVAGVAAGNTYDGTGSTDGDGYYRGQGQAPAALLYAVKIFDNTGGWVGPIDSREIIQRGYEGGAVVHSNSWGAVTDGNYGTRASQYDDGARIYNMIVSVSAGNSGPGYTTIGEPATGKNVIAVGSTTKPTPTTGPSMSSFSSRGWTQDNRIKPDLVAPGSSVSSQSASDNTGYHIASGTTMSQPGVAGAATLVYEWYRDNHVDNEVPSPAMVKALLINTANRFTGHIPNRDEGWGMADISKLERPLDDPMPFYLSDQEHVFTASGQTNEHMVMSDREGEPLKFSLVWTDKEAPGNTGSGPALINDLNIIIESPSGLIYRGNAFINSWTVPGAEAMSDFDRNGNGWDDTNNVENVFIHPDDVELGVYTVTVEARTIADDAVGVGYNSQHYALVVYNGKSHAPGDQPEVTVTRPDGGEVFTAGTQEDITWTAVPGNDPGDPIDYIHLSYSINAGTSWTVIATGLPNTGTYIWTLPNENSDQCHVRVRAFDTMGRMGEDVSNIFTMQGIPPAPPQSLLVEHYGVNVEVLYDDDVEGGDLGYTTGASHPPPASTWDIRSHGSSSGTYSWDFGDNGFYKTGDYGYLSWAITPAIDIPANADPDYGMMFTFQHWRDWGDTSLYDAGNVKISTDGVDGPWTLIIPEEGYDGTVPTSWSNPLGGELAWGGVVGWTTATFDLTGYIGETVHIRYDAGIEAWDGLDGSGWRVDDMYMEALIGDASGDYHNLVTWDASTDDLDEVSHYNLYRSVSIEGPWVESNFVETIPADGSIYYQYIDLYKGMADDIAWWYVVRAVGTNGLEEQNTDAASEPCATMFQYIPLESRGEANGWNFISYSIYVHSESLTDLLHPITGSYDHVMYYDTSLGEWLSYLPGRADRFNTLDTWTRSMGIWIRAVEDVELQIIGAMPWRVDITLYPGWNMVGYPSSTSNNVMETLPPEVTKIGIFNRTLPYNVEYLYDLSTVTLSPRKGYWLYNSADEVVVWTVYY